MTQEPRKQFRVTLESVSDASSPERRLARVLKALLRAHGFRCLLVEEIEEEKDDGDNDG